jgi:type VI protein secretion system component VasF
MTGNVVVDDIQTEEEQPGRRAPVWLLALGGIALVVLFMLPGHPRRCRPHLR